MKSSKTTRPLGSSTDARWSLERWPRWSPWLFLAIGTLLGPLFAYSPWLYVGVTLACVISGWLLEG